MKVAHLQRYFGDQRNFHSTSDSSDDNRSTKNRKYKPYEEISGEFKKIKLPEFNGETEKVLGYLDT